MSRKRQISPAFVKHADLYDAEVASQLPLRMAFAALWTVTDRRGVFLWSRSLKPDVLPYDPCDMLAVLDALERYGFVRKYEVDGKPYGFLPSFGKHQHFHKDERVSSLPGPPPHLWSTVAAPGHGGAPEVDAPQQQADLRHTASDIRHTAPTTSGDGDARFAAVWRIYPRRLGGNSRPDAYKAWRARLAAGVDASELVAGVERYAAFVTATGKAGTEYVKQAATFFGPAQHWTEAWEIPPPAVVRFPAKPTPAEQMAANLLAVFPRVPA